MERRDMEGSHIFSNKIKTQCGIYDLQGLLLNKKGNFTAAIEAFEYNSHDQLKSIVPNLMTRESVFAKSLFASSVGVDLFVFVHLSNTNSINIYQVKPDLAEQKAKCVSTKTISEEQFISWWAEHKQTNQMKPYRDEVTSRMRRSYFDGLLESHGLKWGGNIDGFTIDLSGSPRVSSIIENRFSKFLPVQSYDPAKYFQSGGGDYHSWSPLFKIKEKLNVPLILCTYSKLSDHIMEIGATKIETLNNDGIKYDETIGAPTSNVFLNAAEFQRWFEKTIV